MRVCSLSALRPRPGFTTSLRSLPRCFLRPVDGAMPSLASPISRGNRRGAGAGFVLSTVARFFPACRPWAGLLCVGDLQRWRRRCASGDCLCPVGRVPRSSGASRCMGSDEHKVWDAAVGWGPRSPGQIASPPPGAPRQSPAGCKATASLSPPRRDRGVFSGSRVPRRLDTPTCTQPPASVLRTPTRWTRRMPRTP